jgi:hypothetical protein
VARVDVAATCAVVSVSEYLFEPIPLGQPNVGRVRTHAAAMASFSTLGLVAKRQTGRSG